MVDLDLKGKRVLIREDLNVPVSDGVVTSDARIRAALPTIQAVVDAGAAVMLMSHLGRPTEGQPENIFSLQPVASRLAELLGRDVPLVQNWIDGVDVALERSGGMHTPGWRWTQAWHPHREATEETRVLPRPPDLCSRGLIPGDC